MVVLPHKTSFHPVIKHSYTYWYNPNDYKAAYTDICGRIEDPNGHIDDSRAVAPNADLL
jgi:hypothetical protein